MATVEEPKGYAARAMAIAEEWRIVDVSSAADAKAALSRWRIAQKELAWIKAQVNLHIKGMRSDGATAVERAVQLSKPRPFESRGDGVRRKADARGACRRNSA